jgi:hypothetical protein
MLQGFGLLCLMIHDFGWEYVWSSLRIFTFVPPFADMRSIQAAVFSSAAGYDPQIANPADPWGRSMNYPMLWLQIARLLGLNEEFNFILFVFGMLAAYLATMLTLAWRSGSLWMVFIFFSGASLLLMERGNNDLLILSLVALVAVVPGRIGLVIYAVAIMMKVYPVFALAALWRRPVLGLIGFLVGSAILIVLAGEILLIRAATPTETNLSYGAFSLAAHFFKGQNMILAGAAIAAIVCGAALAASRLVARRMSLDTTSLTDVQLFCAGSGIYFFTFLFGSNFDYRLIYLALCIPFLCRQSHLILSWLTPALIVVAANENIGFAIGGKPGVAFAILCKTAVCIIVGSVFVALSRELPRLYVDLLKSVLSRRAVR